MSKIWFMLLVFISTSALPYCLAASADSDSATSEALVIHANDYEDAHWLLRSVADGEETSSRNTLNFDKILKFNDAIQYQASSFRISYACVTSRMVITISKERIHLRNSIFLI
jgi:hypothetical protein